MQFLEKRLIFQQFFDYLGSPASGAANPGCSRLLAGSPFWRFAWQAILPAGGLSGRRLDASRILALRHASLDVSEGEESRAEPRDPL
jgi:hypothetical protein